MIIDIEADAAIVPLAHQRRRHQREDLCFKVRFHVLADEEALRFLDRLQPEPKPAKTSRASGPGHVRAVVEESYTGNLSAGGLGLCGLLETLRGHVLEEGDFLKLEIQPPRVDLTVRCLGRVVWMERHLDAGVFRAGVSFVAVNPGDLKKIRGAAEASL